MDAKKRKKKIQDNLRTIAQMENRTEAEIREDIAAAISYAIKNPDPDVQKFLENVPSLGKSPTIEDVIDYIILTFPLYSIDNIIK